MERDAKYIVEYSVDYRCDNCGWQGKRYIKRGIKAPFKSECPRCGIIEARKQLPYTPPTTPPMIPRDPPPPGPNRPPWEPYSPPGWKPWITFTTNRTEKKYDADF